jgi:hypothetical protein
MGLTNNFFYTETDGAFIDVAHDVYAAGQHIRPNDPNKPVDENGIIRRYCSEAAGLWPIEGKYSPSTRA